jgi:hypothetical protein
MAYIGVPPADRTSGARVRDEFTADGTQVCFQLSQEVPGSFESNIIAVVENVIQEPVSAYTIVDTVTLSLTSISGTFTKNETITGGTSAATGKVIQVNTKNIVVRAVSGTFTSTEAITGGTSSATATITAKDTNIGRGLNFTGTPTSGSKVYVLHQASATYNLKPAAGSVTPESLSDNLRTFTVDKFTATASQTAFTLSVTPISVNSILVFVDGVMQTATTHYTVSSATLTMGSALASGQQVTVVHLGFSTVSRTAFTDGSVTNTMLADGSVGISKLSATGTASSSTFHRGDNTWAVVSVTPTAVSDQANTSTGYFDVPSGTTAQRPASPNTGMLRYNTDTGSLEQYTSTGWSALSPPPAVTSVSPTAYNGASGTSFTINGQAFDGGASVKFITSGGVEYTAATVSYVNSSTLTATTSQAFTVAQEPLSVKVVNGSGLTATLSNVIDCGGIPTWSTASGQIGGSILEGDTVSTSVTATDPDAGASVSYAVTSGALPSGISLNTSSGAITGTAPAVSADTTYNFNITPTDNAGNPGSSRAFSMIIRDDKIGVTDYFADSSGYALYQMTGNLNDTAGVRNGTNTASITFTSTGVKSAGYGQMAVFNGSSNYGTLFTKPSGNFSSSCWFKTTTSGRYIFGDVGGAYNIAWTTYLSSTTQVTHVIDAPGGPTYNVSGTVASGTLTDGNWHHLVITESGSTITIYIDGVSAGSGSANNRTGVNTIKLGSYDGSGSFWNGNIDQVRFFSKALSGAEVTSLYNFENTR